MLKFFPYSVLETASNSTELAYDREHVTPYIYNHPNIFRRKNVTWYRDASQYRLTVDTPEDFALISRIIENLYPDSPEFNIDDILTLLRQNPEMLDLNRHIIQRT